MKSGEQTVDVSAIWIWDTMTPMWRHGNNAIGQNSANARGGFALLRNIYINIHSNKQRSSYTDAAWA